MKIIVGLGNPGPKYRRTRHNLGFMVLDLLAEELGTSFSREKHGGLLAQAALDEDRLLLVKPLTYMNNSGDCVARVARNKIESPASLLVTVDDVNLPLGRIRLRAGGSAGGHNGLKSLVERLGSQDFPRIRLGVGPGEADEDRSGHVLSKFRPEEWPEVEEMVVRAADAAVCWAAEGIAKAMDRFN